MFIKKTVHLLFTVVSLGLVFQMVTSPGYSLANEIDDIPYYEDFSGLQGVGGASKIFPPGWEHIGEVYTSTWSTISAIDLRFPSPTANPVAMIPEIDADINISTLTLTFDAYYTSGDSGDKINVGFISNPADANTFTLIETISLSGSVQTYTVSLYDHEDSYGRRVAFMPQRGGIWNAHYVGKIGLDCIENQFTTIWSKSTGDYAWMGTGSTERGMAYHGGKLYVASRGSGNAVRIIDAADGDNIGSLNASTLSGGALAMSAISTSDDGAIFVANLTTNASTSPFKVYMWEDDEDDTPQTVVNWTAPSAMRLVDNLTVSGSIGDGSAVIYAAVGTDAEMYRWVMESNGLCGYQFKSEPEHFSLPNITSWGTPGWIAPKASGPDAGFFAGGRSANVSRSYTVANSNTGYFNMPPTTSTGTSAASYQTYDDQSYLFAYRATDRRVYLHEVGTSGTEATNRTGSNIDESSTMGSTTENVSGDLAVANYGDGIMKVYVLATNNGIWAYRINLGYTYEPPVTPVSPPGNVVWWKARAQDSMPGWFGSSTERGLAVVEEDAKTLMLIHTAPVDSDQVAVCLVDAESGEDIGPMDLAGYSSGGIFHLADVAVSDDNKIFLANYTQSDAIPFKVYKYNSTTDTSPEVVIEHSPSALGSNWHLSRNIFVTGSYANGTATLLANNDHGSNRFLVARYTQTGPGKSFGEPEIIDVGGSGSNPVSTVSRPGTGAPIYHTTTGSWIRKNNGYGDDLFYINNSDQELQTDGFGRLHFLGTTAGGDDYFGVFKHDRREAWLVKVPPGEDRGEHAEVIAKTPALGTASTLGLGDIRFIQDDNGFDVYYLAANNGIGRARINHSVTFIAEEDLMVGSSEDGRGWRMFSMPVGGVTIKDLSEQYFVQGFEPELFPRYGPNILFVDTGANEWSAKGRDQNYVFPAGEGFIWFFYNGETGGYPNDDPLPVWLRQDGTTPSSNVSDYGLTQEGSNLIGNPFNRDLDVTEIVNWVNQGLTSVVVQVWDNRGSADEVDPENGGYSHSGTWRQLGDTGQHGDKIAPWQGFVLENDNSNQITFPIASAPRFRGRETGFYKSREKPSWHRLSFSLLNIEANGNRTVTDEAASLLFHPEASNGWDIYDASKMTPICDRFATLSFLGERNGESILKSQESRPLDFEGQIEIPVSFESYELAGSFEIKWDGLDELPEEWHLMLADHEAGTLTDLRLEESLVFSIEEPLRRSSARDGETQKGFASGGAPAQLSAEELAGSEVLPFMESLSLPVNFSGLRKYGTQGNATRFTLMVSTEPISGEILADLPEKVELSQNYPNPFNPVTVLPYALPEESHVRLTIYDVLGRQVAVLVDGVKEAGRYEVSWDATRQASGVYIYRLEAGGEAFTRKMTLVK